MQYPIKSASLSRHASTSHHGRLLQDSGFTKRDSTPDLSESWEPTITSRQDVWYSRSSTPTGRLSSGRPEIQSIPRAEPSTSVLAFREIASMYSMEEKIWALRSALQKTSCLPSRSDAAVRPSAMPSWERPSVNIPSPFWQAAMFPLLYGSIPIRLARQLGKQSLSNLDFSEYELRISALLKIPSTTA